MSNAQKKPEPNAEDVFSIDFDDQGKSNMPGVTQLINPEVLRRRAEAQAAFYLRRRESRRPAPAATGPGAVLPTGDRPADTDAARARSIAESSGAHAPR